MLVIKMPPYASLSSKGGISSQTNLASIEGLRILENGGNAFDAAITVSSMLTVLLPHTGSAGGDAFVLGLSANNELIAYNGSGKSPRDFSVEQFLQDKPVRGPLSFTVPGLVDVWDWMNSEYGSVDLEALLEKATTLARDGFVVQEALAEAVESNKPTMQKYKEWDRNFGRVEKGSKTSFSNLAGIYEAIGKKGADSFYRSKHTEQLVDALTQQGVQVSCEDFAKHKGEVVRTIKCEYKDCELFELPPNSQGISTLQLLKTIDIAGLNRMPNLSPTRLKEFFAIAACVYQDRDRHVADPRSCEIPVERLLSFEYLNQNTPWKLDRSIDGSQLDSQDTTFFVVADKHGNLLGFIQSIFHHFGSGIVALDIPFQNRAAGFAKKPGLPNSPFPEKRPLHTLSILLARNELQGDHIIGCAGGDYRPQIHSQIFTNLADYGMNLSKAVNAPRYLLTSWQNGKMEALTEEGAWSSSLPCWVRKTKYQPTNTGIVHAAIRRRDGVTEFAADPRGGGLAVPHL